MAMTLITTNTSSDAATSDFTSSIDSTYKLYIFKFINIDPATDNTKITFQGSTDGGSNYGVTLTTTSYSAYHNEADNDTSVAYRTGDDLAQSTSFQQIARELGTDSDQSSSAELYLFNPSNTTYVKHFYSTSQTYTYSDYSENMFVAGYFNTTSAIDAIQFKMSSGNIASGTIKMYGVG
jgi:hypothetical protein